MRTITKIYEDGIVLSDGSRLSDYHDQDCCEHVYAAWSEGLADVNLSELDVTDINIEPVIDAGFRLNGQFIPCYNSQNGYYSDNLAVVYTDPNGTEVWSQDVPKTDQID